MENFIISIIILSVVIIFVIINSFIICGICDDIIGLVDEGKTEEAIALWESKREYIAFFVRDAEIDCVDGFTGGLGGQHNLNDEEAKAKSFDFKSAVAEIKDSEMPNIGNIF